MSLLVILFFSSLCLACCCFFLLTFLFPFTDFHWLLVIICMQLCEKLHINDDDDNDNNDDGMNLIAFERDNVTLRKNACIEVRSKRRDCMQRVREKKREILISCIQTFYNQIVHMIHTPATASSKRILQPDYPFQVNICKSMQTNQYTTCKWHSFNVQFNTQELHVNFF